MEDLKLIAKDMTEVRELHEKQGGFFFKKSNMTFFNSSVESELFKPYDLFITKDTNRDNDETGYTVRHFSPIDGSILSESEYQEFKTYEDAENFIKSYNKSDDESYDDEESQDSQTAEDYFPESGAEDPTADFVEEKEDDK